MVKEVLEKKVVWPWVAPNEDDSNRRRKILKSCGFKEWKDPKAKSAADNKWKLRYALEAKTGTAPTITKKGTVLGIPYFLEN